ncbi:ligand-binding sensor domain-containing protein [Actinomadura macrotermitis]|uniref:Uncharacterized protein n=1 Tax=Actinomadura macrotermitis TaxID=2585200 RepID=A0A7K0C1H4_9ACTN|nr:hypothetical protein [Actinomadura macrotermitis]MQY07297.1 hypothetical protein [Actinomadura macrotermitis]
MRLATPVFASALLLTAAVAAPAEAATTGFTSAPAPFFWPRSGLEAVSASGPADVWASGYQGYQGIDWSIPGFGAGTVHVLPPKAAVSRWDGRSWKNYDLPDFGGDGVVSDIAAGSPSNVWAVGRLRPNSSNDSAAYLAHFDGTAWKKVTMPETCLPTTPVADPAGDGLWVGCWQQTYRYQDGKWTQHDAGAPPDRCCIGVHEISVAPDRSAWAGTTWGLRRWTGSAWAKVEEVEKGVIVEQVLAIAADDVYIAGSKYTDASGQNPMFRHWDGRTWQDLKAEGGYGKLLHSSDGAVWKFIPNRWGGLYRLDGDSWTQVTVPVPSDGYLTDVASVPGSPVLWAVGKTKNVPVVARNG